MWWVSFIIAIVIIIIIAIIMMIRNAKTGKPCRPCDAKFLATVLDQIRLYHAEEETVLEARVATLVIITSSLFFNMRQTISATAGGLFWLRGFSLGGAWLMMGELLMMIVMIKKCTNSSQSCKLMESQRKNFNFNVFFFLMGHTHNLLRWTLDLLYIFSLLSIKYYDNEMFTISNEILMARCVLHAVFAQQMQSSSRQPAL